MNKLKQIITNKILLLIIIPIIIISFFFLIIILQKAYFVFPNSKYKFNKICDYVNDNGNSEISEIIKSQNEIIFKYTLKEGFEYPYAGMQFYLDEYTNLNKYDYVKIKVKTTNSKSIRLYIKINLDDFTKNNSDMSYLHLVQEIPVSQNKGEYIFKLNNINTPKWWYTLNNLSESDKIIKRDLSKVKYIQIENAVYQEKNIQDTIVLKEISFHKNKLKTAGIGVIILCIYLIITIFYLILNSYFQNIIKKTKNIIKPAEYLELKNDIDLETLKLIQYLGENYNNCNLSVERVSYECGVSIFKIPNILKNQFKLSFPQYLNAIRLAEAKRLLQETDRHVSDIAFNVGYNNISHFVHLFKKIEKKSPVEYRKDLNTSF